MYVGFEMIWPLCSRLVSVAIKIVERVAPIPSSALDQLLALW